jgi:oligopeptide transport system substrate-binding protein
MDMRNLRKPLALILALGMLAGCGSSSAAAATEAATAAAASTGKTVVIATDTDLSTMDHHIATDGTSFIAQSLVFDGLTELNAAGEAQPDLATSWDVSDDGLTYTFHLADAKWSNGTAVTAADFVYGWQKLVDPAVASEYAFIVDTIHVVNAADCISGAKPITDLGVEATDDKTFVVHLSLPCSFLPGLMAFPPFFPLNQAYYESQGDQYSLTPENMIYCGPYVMSSWTAGSGYTFTKNPDYFKADEVKTDEIDFQFIQDTQSAMLAYQSGTIDVVKLTGEMVDQYKDSEGFTNRLEGYLWYLSLNFTVDKFKNANLRQAMAYAIDRETIAKDVLKNGSIAADGLIPTSFATGPDGNDYRADAPKLTSYDPAKAAEYYAKAKEELGGDVQITLLFEDTEASKAVAEYIQNNLETNCPGLTVTLDSKPKKTRLQLMTDQNYEVALTRWGPDYADPQTYMDLFTTDNTANNSGRYSNADYDAAIEEADNGASAADPAKRWELWQKAEKIIVQDDPGVIPVYQNGGAMMINPKVTGIEFHSAGVDSYRHLVKAD